MQPESTMPDTAADASRLAKLSRALRDEKYVAEKTAERYRCPLVAATLRQRAAVVGEALVNLESEFPHALLAKAAAPSRRARVRAAALRLAARCSRRAEKHVAANVAPEDWVRSEVAFAYRAAPEASSSDERAAKADVERALATHTPQFAATHGGPSCS